MTADQVAALVTAIAAGVAALVLVGVVVVLGRRVRELGRAVDELRRETVPLVHDALFVVDQAATEMVRVGDVLDSAEAVLSATVDSASRLAYRTLSNPVVKVLAYSTGLGSALRRFFGRHPVAGEAPRPSTNGHVPLSRYRFPRPPRPVGAVGAPTPSRRDPTVIRRPLWLAAGAVLGAGGTLWTCRRLERLSRRVRPTAVAGEVVSMVDRTRRNAADKVRDALHRPQ